MKAVLNIQSKNWFNKQRIDICFENIKTLEDIDTAIEILKKQKNDKIIKKHLKKN